LVAFGISTDGEQIYAKSLGINVNLWWGLVLLAFGLIMLLLGRRSQKRLAKLAPAPAEKGQLRRGH
jgi:hypothetical protein